MKPAIHLAILPLLGACTSHDPHRVTDLSNGRVYYTKEMRRGLASGKVRLTDARTGQEVTIGSSEVQEIPEEEFARAVAAK
jgi:hypothetical protein